MIESRDILDSLSVGILDGFLVGFLVALPYRWILKFSPQPREEEEAGQ